MGNSEEMPAGRRGVVRGSEPGQGELSVSDLERVTWRGLLQVLSKPWMLDMTPALDSQWCLGERDDLESPTWGARTRAQSRKWGD